MMKSCVIKLLDDFEIHCVCFFPLDSRLTGRFSSVLGVINGSSRPHTFFLSSNGGTCYFQEVLMKITAVDSALAAGHHFNIFFKYDDGGNILSR